MDFFRDCVCKGKCLSIGFLVDIERGFETSTWIFIAINRASIHYLQISVNSLYACVIENSYFWSGFWSYLKGTLRIKVGGLKYRLLMLKICK